MENSRTLKWLMETEVVENISEYGGREHYYLGVRPKMECHDGFSMSVQASPHHYCNFYSIDEGVTPFLPGTDQYRSVEVYCLSQPESLLDEYGGGIEDPACYVPIEVIDAIIEKHGGMVGVDPAPPPPPEPDRPKLKRTRKLTF